MIPVLLPLPYVFTYLCASTASSHITPLSHAEHLRIYPYDYTLYHPDINCRTCGFVKPARSKHCSTCKTCVARADHHCVWVNRCVGRANHHWFILLLMSIGTLLCYGVYLAYNVLSAANPPLPYVPLKLLQWHGSGNPPDHSRELSWSRYFSNLSICISAYPSIAGVGLLALFTAPLAWGLWTYHLYLIWAGTTTNENGKWGDWEADMADGCVFKGRRTVLCPQKPRPRR